MPNKARTCDPLDRASAEPIRTVLPRAACSLLRWQGRSRLSSGGGGAPGTVAAGPQPVMWQATRWGDWRPPQMGAGREQLPRLPFATPSRPSLQRAGSGIARKPYIRVRTNFSSLQSQNSLRSFATDRGSASMTIPLRDRHGQDQPQIIPRVRMGVNGCRGFLVLVAHSPTGF
jgi:hypothetical protein